MAVLFVFGSRIPKKDDSLDVVDRIKDKQEYKKKEFPANNSRGPGHPVLLARWEAMQP